MIESSILDWCSLVRVETEIDVANSQQLADTIAAIDADRTLAVDLTGCTYMDSSGLGVLLQTHRVRNDLWIVVPPTSQVRRLLAIAGVLDHLHVAASLDDVRTNAGMQNDVG